MRRKTGCRLSSSTLVLRKATLAEHVDEIIGRQMAHGFEVSIGRGGRIRKGRSNGSPRRIPIKLLPSPYARMTSPPRKIAPRQIPAKTAAVRCASLRGLLSFALGLPWPHFSLFSELLLSCGYPTITSDRALPICSEHFQAKWTPVRVKKMRQYKDLEPCSDSIGTEKALAWHQSRTIEPAAS